MITSVADDGIYYISNAIKEDLSDDDIRQSFLSAETYDRRKRIMSNLEHLIENSLSELEKFVGSGEDVNKFNERWRESIVTDPNYEGADISPEDIMEICVYFLFTWCQCCDKREKK